MFCGFHPRPMSKAVLRMSDINSRNELVHVWNNSNISQGPTGLTNIHVSLYQMHTCIVGVRNSRYPYISVYWCIAFVYGTLYRSYDGHVRLLWWFFSWLPVGRRNKCHINSSKEDVISLHGISLLTTRHCCSTGPKLCFHQDQLELFARWCNLGSDHNAISLFFHFLEWKFKLSLNTIVSRCWGLKVLYRACRSSLVYFLKPT